MFFELPEETCEAGGSGVPLSAAECDSILPAILSPGPFVLLTDGAGAYQSVAPRERVAYHTNDHEPNQFSSARYNEFYKHLNISHGIVSHTAEQWAEVDRVQVVHPSGQVRWKAIKKGTQQVDGLWPELRASIPDSVHTSDWARCRTYMWSWVWRMRRVGLDNLVEFGKLLSRLRQTEAQPACKGRKRKR